jgi:hypothetical protein
MDSRFVVQEHTTPAGVHWDLMLEKGAALMTFRLPERPENALHHAMGAVQILDHALRFLTYEGPVQKGTGWVRIVERGTYRLLEEKDGSITLDLQGTFLQGGFTLTRKEGTLWELVSAGSTGSR